MAYHSDVQDYQLRSLYIGLQLHLATRVLLTTLPAEVGIKRPPILNE